MKEFKSICQIIVSCLFFREDRGFGVSGIKETCTDQLSLHLSLGETAFLLLRCKQSLTVYPSHHPTKYFVNFHLTIVLAPLSLLKQFFLNDRNRRKKTRHLPFLCGLPGSYFWIGVNCLKI